MVKVIKLYSSNSPLLQSILNSSDAELIALTLYVFGKLAYDRKLRRKLKSKVGVGATRSIKYKIIPMLGMTLEKRISETGLILDVASVPRGLIAKIQLARIESGLDKPFMLSKFEWKVYQETLKALRLGYHRVHRRHLLIGLILNGIFLLPSIINVLISLLPNSMTVASAITEILTLTIRYC